jgi:hypothetical protein
MSAQQRDNEGDYNHGQNGYKKESKVSSPPFFSLPVVDEVASARHILPRSGRSPLYCGMTLSPIRNGIPFSLVFSEVWHYVFGFAAKSLHLGRYRAKSTV